MHILIFLSIISSVFSCNYQLYFNKTNHQVLVIPDEAFEYEFNFVFNRNVSYEFGIIKYYGSQCNMILNCECPMNNEFSLSYLYYPGTYYSLSNGSAIGQEFNMTVASSCSKYRRTPFVDYTYECDTSYVRGRCYYVLKVVTILINDDINDIKDINVMVNYTQNKKFTDEELKNTERFKCECTNKTDVKSNIEAKYLLLPFCAIILIVVIVANILIKKKRDKINDTLRVNNIINYGSTEKL